jgi:hypothetical protein
LVCLGFLLASLARDASLWVFGRRAEAQIEELWAESVGGEDTGEQDFRYFVRYQFRTEQGQVLTGTSRVGAGEWGGLGTAGQARVDWNGSEIRAVAPVYQEQEHVPPEPIGGMEAGSPITVVYFPLYPEHNRLDESRYATLLACAYVPFLAVAGGLALGGWRLVRNTVQGM